LIYVVMLEPLPGIDSVKALRGFLKLALRRFGLKCISVQECSDSKTNVMSANCVQ